MGISRFFTLFSKMWKIGEMKSTDKTEDRADSWPTPTSTLKEGEMKLFHK